MLVRGALAVAGAFTSTSTVLSSYILHTDVVMYALSLLPIFPAGGNQCNPVVGEELGRLAGGDVERTAVRHIRWIRLERYRVVC